MSKIRILAVPPDTHGVGKYRILNPYTYIQEHYPDDFHIDIKMDVPDDDKEFDDYDIIVLHTYIHNKVSPERNLTRIKWLREKGKPVIVYEVREEKGKARFLVGTKNGEIKWFDGSLFREYPRQVN